MKLLDDIQYVLSDSRLPGGRVRAKCVVWKETCFEQVPGQ